MRDSLVDSMDQSRCAPSQWETSLQCNDGSYWLGAHLKWPLQQSTKLMPPTCQMLVIINEAGRILMRASDFYIGCMESFRMRASNPKNEFCGLTWSGLQNAARHQSATSFWVVVIYRSIYSQDNVHLNHSSTRPRRVKSCFGWVTNLVII